jgi:hypothetical protein
MKAIFVKLETAGEGYTLPTLTLRTEDGHIFIGEMPTSEVVMSGEVDHKLGRRTTMGKNMYVFVSMELMKFQVAEWMRKIAPEGKEGVELVSLNRYHATWLWMSLRRYNYDNTMSCVIIKEEMGELGYNLGEDGIRELNLFLDKPVDEGNFDTMKFLDILEGCYYKLQSNEKEYDKLRINTNNEQH